MVEDAVELVKRATAAAAVAHVYTGGAAGDGSGAAAGSLAGAAQGAVVAVAALVAAMVVAAGSGSEEVCQGNQWRAARAGAVEVRSFLHGDSCDGADVLSQLLAVNCSITSDRHASGALCA